MAYTPLVIFIALVLIIGGAFLQYMFVKLIYNSVASPSQPPAQAGGRGKHRGGRRHKSINS